MSHKQMLFHEAAREKVLRGTAALYEAVRFTLGPKSKCVLIEKKWGAPLVCDDGVTIAKEISLKDPEENLGARMIREAAEQTGSAVGDGTTTATILAYHIFAEGVRNVVAGASARGIKRGLERGLEIVVSALKDLSRPVQSRKEKEQIASISAHGDTRIGALIADAVERVGSEGVISVEEAKGTETSLEVVEGMQFDHGYLSAYFVTNPERLECVLEEPLILLHEKRLGSMQPLLPLLEHCAKAGQPLLVIAEEVEGEALATLVVNKLRGALLCAAVKAPAFGDRRKAILQDIATLTGGQLIAEELGTNLEKVGPEVLGRANRVVLTKDTTMIIGGQGSKPELKARVDQLRKEIQATTSDYDREKLQERLAKLAGGVAVIRVGAPTEAEMKSKKEAFEDAISATKAAAAEGIVPGAGFALLRAVSSLEAEEAKAEGEEKTGLKILKKALEAPTRQLAENAEVDGGVIIEKMRSSKDSLGLNASTGKLVSLLEAGIIDPTKVVRIALENAISVASTLLLTEATLTDIPEDKTEAPPQLS